MAAAFQMQSYFRSTPLTVDTAQAQKYFEEEDSSILDDSVLDRSALDSGLEMSPPMADSRRDSLALGSSLFSPKTEDWHSVDMQSVPSNNPFLEQPQHSNNPFMRLDHSQSSAFGFPGGAWSMGNGSGSCTPLQQFEGMTGEYDATASIFQRPMSGQTPFSNPTNQLNMFSSLGSGTQSIPTSPHKNWLGQNESMVKKMRADSPGLRSHNDLRRGDGIRKKNARFDIPAERNLNNIDHLIAQSNDDKEIKELKQQKRLLRNRQAALDSRQRKKQHTERLEDEKKHYTAILNDMEEEITGLKTKMEQMMREKQSYQEYIESLSMEKEEMIRAHTIETGELRKKVSVLADHVQKLEDAAMSSGIPDDNNNNNNFAPVYDDMSGMTMTGPWGNVGYLGDYQVEPDVKQEQEPRQVQTKKNDAHFASDAEKPASQGGILFMLFLVGAFVLSNRSTPSIPRVSDDVRAEAATLLENVFKDAGVSEPSNTMMQHGPPQPSSASWGNNPSLSMADTPMGNMMPSMLGQLSDSLTRPTSQQTNEQIFSLSAAQYNGVHAQDFVRHAPERTTSQGRRNLAEALASMRRNNKQSAAEVYTRSLLWDQIPSEVVKNFAKMVTECNNAQQNEQQCTEAT